MKEIILQHVSEKGGLVKATFLPENGMNLKSLIIDSIELIDQSTQNLFDEKMAGLGALIGPHFYHRKEIPKVPDDSIFPHIRRIKAKGGEEPFSHGIGRYVAWNYSASDLSIDGFISGMDTISGVTFAALEGFDFEMHFKATITAKGLEIDMYVESEKVPSIAGLHYYYALTHKKGFVKMRCNDHYNDMGLSKPIPDAWKDPTTGDLHFNLDNESDYTFWPTEPREVILETGNHKLRICYQTDTDEHGVQLYHPKGESFVCIEPVTAKNPRAVKQKRNHLKVNIEVV